VHARREEFREEQCLQCRHQLDPGKLQATKNLLVQLSTTQPGILDSAGIQANEWAPLLRMAIESMRGSFAASGAEKRRFIEAVLNHMEAAGTITEWQFVGQKQRQDYRVTLPDERVVSIEAKGCGDGNNMGIWDRPRWADEFVIWSQCPESLQHEPGEGVWSALATRIISKVIAEEVVVDCFVFFDGRCGSELRRCPKNRSHGVEEDLRPRASDIPGQDGGSWMPPPCVYLLPRSVADPSTNPVPPLHSLDTCRFAAAMLRAFNVPTQDAPAETHWARVHAENRSDGRYYQVIIGSDLANPRQLVVGRWKRLRRD
jgi:hypothetical protein